MIFIGAFLTLFAIIYLSIFLYKRDRGDEEAQSKALKRACIIVFGLIIISGTLIALSFPLVVKYFQ